MSGAARIHMQHFQATRLAAPAAVMLAQLQALGSALPVSATLFRNPALLLRALDAVHRTDSFASATPLAKRLAQLDPDWLESLIRLSALHLALQDGLTNQAFLLRHWHLSRRLALLAAALAQASAYADTDGAACCGALLRAGMLVLEQQQNAAYAVLTADEWHQPLQISAERELFQLDHVEAGVRLLEDWELDQFSVDALRYQVQPLEQVLDAAPLVKICWYANALAEGVTPQLLHAGRELLNLAAGQVQAVLERTQQELDSECAASGVAELRGAASNGELAHEAQQKLLQLRQEISTDNLLAQHAGSHAAPALQLARVLQDAGIEPRFIVLGPGEARLKGAPVPREAAPLSVHFSHGTQANPAGLSLVCAAGRNALSTFILAGEPGVLSTDTPALTVIDRQLLALLGGQALVCEPLRAGNRTLVLLLGLNASAVTHYLSQHTVRRFISRLLLAPQKTDDSASTLLLQKRVREAVHEANNPLAIIKNYLYVLGMKQGAGQLPEEVQLIRAEIDRVAAILAELREPSAATSAPRKLPLNKVVSAMHRLFANAFQADGKRITVELRLTDGDPQVFGSESALKQILTNLVKNAAEAIAGEGTITLVTHSHVYLHDRLYAQLSVHDDGAGIAPELMSRLFKPGTSTKGGAHAGSGLGIVRRLVEEMGGQISCRSSSNGTAMDILLPLSE